jgi:hypothetical protein
MFTAVRRFSRENPYLVSKLSLKGAATVSTGPNWRLGALTAGGSFGTNSGAGGLGGEAKIGTDGPGTFVQKTGIG